LERIQLNEIPYLAINEQGMDSIFMTYKRFDALKGKYLTLQLKNALLVERIKQYLTDINYYKLQHDNVIKQKEVILKYRKPFKWIGYGAIVGFVVGVLIN